jgi:hypothetical protein
MKKLVLLVALLATACGQAKLSPEQIAGAMPQADVISIDQPNPGLPTGNGPPGLFPSLEAATDAPATTAPAAATPAGRSPLAVVSYLFARSVNVGVFWTLAPIAFLTEFVPPTSCTATACTWGPGSRPAELNDWMLVVTRAGDAYDYTLSGRPKVPVGSPFVSVLTGRAYPGAVRFHGHGTFSVDFDTAWDGLAHAVTEVKSDFGSIAVDYDARQGLTVDVTILDARNSDDPGADVANPNRVNAVYAFHRDASGGDLQLGWRALPPSVPQTRTLHTRWQPGGAGRADFKVILPAAQAAVSQCWAGAPDYLMTFDGTSTTTLTDPSVCVFADAAPITIAVP